MGYPWIMRSPSTQYRRGVSRWVFPIRRWHIWAGVLSSLPALIILVSGLVLLLRRELPSIHPPTERGSQNAVQISFPQAVQAAGIELADVKKAEIHPSRGIWKVRTKDSREIQVDGTTGAVLRNQPRHTGWWIGLHEGSSFSLWVTYGIFLPSTLAMLWLYGSGLYLFFVFRRK